MPTFINTPEDAVDDCVRMLMAEVHALGADGKELVDEIKSFVDTIRKQLRGKQALQALQSIWAGAQLKSAALADEAATNFLMGILSIGLKFAGGLLGSFSDMKK